MITTCPECETVNGHSIDCSRAGPGVGMRSSLVDSHVQEHMAVARSKECKLLPTTYGWVVGGRMMLKEYSAGTYTVCKDYGLSISDLADLQVAIEAAIRKVAIDEVEGA